MAGTYSVNGDCTVSMGLNDVFLPPASGTVGITTTSSTQASFTLEGVAVQSANEIDLTQTGSVTGTSVILTKTRQSCALADLSSAYGISASGYVAGTTTSLTTNAGTITSTTPNTPFNVLGRLVADGNGNFYTDNIGAASPLVNREITGAYIVNTDCTGAGILVTADGKKRGVNFVIVSVGPTTSAAQQQLLIGYTDPGVVGSGIAQQQ